MHVFLLGVSHQTAPIDVREQLDFSSRDVGAAVEALAAKYSAGEAVVLSTCNRSELYVASEDPARAREELVDFLSTYHGLPPQAFQEHVFVHADEDATRHLFRVAAGLDSLVVGEPQILGQVKDAFQVAATRQCVGPVLTRLFHTSFGVGKRVRSETALGEGAVSVGFAAVALARKIFGRLEGRGVLVVGAGEISTLTAQHLRAQGVGEIVITSRTAAHAEALAAEVEGRAIPWGNLRGALETADIVITATGSPRPILARADIEGMSARRRGEPLFIIDIAVPRDVEPSVGDIEQVFLYNVDDLQAVVQENLSRRSAEIIRAETIVTEEGFAPIETLEEGRRVLTHEGSFSPVTAVASHQFDGDLIIDTLHDFSAEIEGAGMAAEHSQPAPGADSKPATFEDPSAWGLDSLLDEDALKPETVPVYFAVHGLPGELVLPM